jgi:hypothetical protein
MNDLTKTAIYKICHTNDIEEINDILIDEIAKAKEEVLNDLIDEIMRIRTLPEQFQEWKGYRNLLNFIHSLSNKENAK